MSDKAITPDMEIKYEDYGDFDKYVEKVVEWIEAWKADNGGSTINEDQIESFMKAFGEKVIDVADYNVSGGSKLILYSGPIGDISGYKVVKSICESNDGYYCISNT